MNEKVFKVSILGFLVIAAVLVVNSAIFAGKSPWSTDINSAYANAKKNDNLVLLQLYSDTCPYCIRMENEVLNEAPIEKICEKINCIKLDGNNGPGRDMVMKFRVMGYPATLILDANGELVTQIQGYRPLDFYIKNIEFIIARDSEFKESLKIVEAGTEDIEAYYKVAEGYYERNNLKKSLEYTNKIIEKDPSNKSGKTPRAYLIKSLIMTLGLKDYKAAVKYLDIILIKWPKDESIKNVLYFKSIILIDSGDSRQAAMILKDIKKRFPEDKALISRVDRALLKAQN